MRPTSAKHSDSGTGSSIIKSSADLRNFKFSPNNSTKSKEAELKAK